VSLQHRHCDTCWNNNNNNNNNNEEKKEKNEEEEEEEKKEEKKKSILFSFGDDTSQTSVITYVREVDTDDASIYIIILVGNQLDTQFLLWYVYLNPLYVSSNSVLILRRTIV
jgi:hypothetical protein